MLTNTVNPRVFPLANRKSRKTLFHKNKKLIQEKINSDFLEKWTKNTIKYDKIPFIDILFADDDEIENLDKSKDAVFSICRILHQISFCWENSNKNIL